MRRMNDGPRRERDTGTHTRGSDSRERTDGGDLPAATLGGRGGDQMISVALCAKSMTTVGRIPIQIVARTQIVRTVAVGRPTHSLGGSTSCASDSACSSSDAN